MSGICESLPSELAVGLGVAPGRVHARALGEQRLDAQRHLVGVRRAGAAPRRTSSSRRSRSGAGRGRRSARPGCAGSRAGSRRACGASISAEVDRRAITTSGTSASAASRAAAPWGAKRVAKPRAAHASPRRSARSGSRPRSGPPAHALPSLPAATRLTGMPRSRPSWKVRCSTSTRSRSVEERDAPSDAARLPRPARRAALAVVDQERRRVPARERRDPGHGEAASDSARPCAPRPARPRCASRRRAALEALAEGAGHAAPGRHEQQAALVGAARHLLEHEARSSARRSRARARLTLRRASASTQPAEAACLELEGADQAARGPRRCAPSSTRQSASSWVPSVGKVAAAERAARGARPARARAHARERSTAARMRRFSTAAPSASVSGSSTQKRLSDSAASRSVARSARPIW